MHAKVYNYLRGDPENDEENSNDSMSIQNESKCYMYLHTNNILSGFKIYCACTHVYEKRLYITGMWS
jgi:hypothetical protein